MAISFVVAPVPVFSYYCILQQQFAAVAVSAVWIIAADSSLFGSS